jgi:hypothetical protein
MTIEQLKIEEFQRRAFELTDEIFEHKIKSITLSDVQLQFYGIELIEVMRTFLNFLEKLQSQPERNWYEDTPFTWHVYADKHKHGYRLRFIQRLDLTKHS